MAFSAKRLWVSSYAEGTTWWGYRVTPGDSFKKVCKPKYFRDAADILRPGDVILATCPRWGAMLLVREVSSEEGVVTAPLRS